MARTVLDEVLQFRPDFIEHQLAHAVRDPNGRAYNRSAHLAERRIMMQSWAAIWTSSKPAVRYFYLRERRKELEQATRLQRWGRCEIAWGAAT